MVELTIYPSCDIRNIQWTKKRTFKRQYLQFYIDEEFMDNFYKFEHNYKHKELYWKYYL